MRAIGEIQITRFIKGNNGRDGRYKKNIRINLS